MYSLKRGTKTAVEARRKAMRFYPTSRSSGSLAMALASTKLFLPHNNISSNLMATAFSSSFCLQQVNSLTEGRGYSSSSELGMSKMNQSFETWSFDKPCKTMAWSPMSVADLAASGSELDTNWTDDADLVFLGVFAPTSDDCEDEGDDDKDEEVVEPTLVGATKNIDEALGGALSNLMIENFKDFKNGAEAGGTLPTLRTYADGKSKRYVIVGLGSEPTESEPLGSIGSAVGKALAMKCDTEKKVVNAKFLLPETIASDAKNLKDMTSAFYSTLYADNRHRTGKKVVTPAEDLQSLTLLADGPSSSETMREAIDTGKKIATGICMTKDIVNAPHNVKNSESLADTAKRIAKESDGSLKCKILGKKECEARGMGAYLGVARGSETEPQFIHITYTPADGDIKKKVGVVGKGLLFDTGGYNIKTSMMELMKFDCGGAAAVLGAARAVGALKPPGVECHFVVAACENMINERAIVPSDILTASNGKTIEVLNTDAEGRLTLADALVYCDKELNCESIIELSTLTGACMIALGKVCKEEFSHDTHVYPCLLCIFSTTLCA
jgi:leucyl aminopeptidase